MQSFRQTQVLYAKAKSDFHRIEKAHFTTGKTFPASEKAYHTSEKTFL